MSRHGTGHVPAERTRAHRRPLALLVALVTGGVVAGLLSPQAAPAATTDPTAVSDLIGASAEGWDEAAELSPQMAITEVEAQARLTEVAASRAERAATAQAAAEAAAEAARPRTVMPINGYRLTSTFAVRWGVMHWGIDLAAPMLTPEYAAADGVVLQAGPASGFGNAIYILHDNGDVTVYGHMERVLVSAGDYVQAGDTIALLGSRGQSTGPHLHFEVHQGGLNGPRIDPIPWLADRGVDV